MRTSYIEHEKGDRVFVVSVPAMGLLCSLLDKIFDNISQIEQYTALNGHKRNEMFF